MYGKFKNYTRPTRPSFTPIELIMPDNRTNSTYFFAIKGQFSY